MRDEAYLMIPDERCLSWNEIWASNHWSVRSRIAKKKHALVRAYINPDVPMFDELVDVIVIATYSDDPVDSDNVCVKPYVDGLKKHLLHDDDNRWVRYVATRAVIGETNMIEIWLRPVGETDGS